MNAKKVTSMVFNEDSSKGDSTVRKMIEMLEGPPILKKKINLSVYVPRKSEIRNFDSSRKIVNNFTPTSSGQGDLKMSTMNMTKSVFIPRKTEENNSKLFKKKLSIVERKDNVKTVKKTVERNYVGVTRSSVLRRESIDRRPVVTRRVKI
jgi:hypothetical protein